MGTTSGALAIELVDLLSRIGEPFAILHREREIARGETDSDVDVAVQREPRGVLRDLSLAARAIGLNAVMYWEYDIASYSSLWVTDGCEHSVQLDLAGDTRGRGRYAFRSSAVVDNRIRGERWDRADSLDSELYLLRKRVLKRDYERARSLRTRILALNPRVVDQRVSVVFSRRAAAEMRSYLVAPTRNRTRPSFQGPRAVRRLMSPVGYVASEVADRSSAAAIEALARELRPVFPHVVTESSTTARARRYVACWRPAIVFANRPHFPGCHVVAVASFGDKQRARCELTRAMANATDARLGAT